jgi:hypothetical protein
LALPLLIWWLLRNIPIAEIGATLGRLSLLQLGALIVLNACIALAFSSRWWLILRALGTPAPYLKLASYRLAGFAVSYFTPGTQFGGEPLQVYLLEKKHQISSSKAVASVALDKLFEVLANFGFLLFGAGVILSGGLSLRLENRWMILWVGAFVLPPLLYLLALGFGKLPLSWLVRKLPESWLRHPLVETAHRIITSSEGQIADLIQRQPLIILYITGASGVIWSLMIVEYWLALNFLGAAIPLNHAIAALTAARLAFLTPLPGGIGALEAGQVLALQSLGFSPALGISLSLLIRGRDLSLGTLGMWLGALLSPKAIRQTATTKMADAGNP